MEEQELRIFLHDFTPEAQERILSFYGLENAQAGNLDIFPVTSLYYDSSEQEDFGYIIDLDSDVNQ